jgi:hypothetical protein
MKKLSLSLALAFLMLATLGYAQSGNPAETSTLAQSAVSPLNPTNPGSNDAPLSLFAGYCLYRGVSNQVILICTDPGINAQSSVFASISQTNSSGRRILGNPIMWVENVVPYNGGVQVLVHTGSETPIDVRLDIVVAQ